MADSITVHQNQGSNPAWENTNVWVGDSSGTRVNNPQSGQIYHLWCQPMNNGTTVNQNVVVSFYTLPPGSNGTWPSSVHGQGSLASLAVGAQAQIMCSTPWSVPAAGHYCLVAAVSCLNCPPPDTTPGTPINPSQQQVAQFNLTVSSAATSAGMVTHNVQTNATGSSCDAAYLEAKRVPLAENADLLKSLGIDKIPAEAPAEKALHVVDTANPSANPGPKLNLDNTRNIDAVMQIHLPDPDQRVAGTAALYRLSHYEDSNVLGGVTRLIQY